MKTHPLAALLTWWAESGRGVEVVSEAELVGALRAACPLDRLLVNGVAKHAWLSRHELRGLRVHFDSLTELRALLPLAVRCEWRVGVRLHVAGERDARDERFGGQFGMTADQAVAALGELRQAGANVEGVHFHLGQAPHSPDAYTRAATHLAAVCREAAFHPRYVDCGGGLPDREAAGPALDGLRRAVSTLFEQFEPDLEEVWLEHGRFVLSHASVLAIRVLDVKERPECRYVICDGGRTNHALAADQDMHPLLSLPNRHAPRRLTTVCGPTCMTDDVLGRYQLPEDLSAGDVLVWTKAGAYHLPWETRFSQGLCAVAWFDEQERMTLARQRERPGHWMQPCQA